MNMPYKEKLKIERKSNFLLFVVLGIILSVSGCKSKRVDNESIEKTVFDDVEITDSMRLIGMHSYHNSNTEFEQYDFIIENKNDIINALKKLKLGLIINNLYTKNEFNIRLLDGDRIVKTISINPNYHYLRTNGKSYRFENAILYSLSEKHSFHYSFSKKEFKSKMIFEQYYQKIKNDNNYLFMFKPNFKFEGKFNIVFLKDNSFPNPKTVINHVESELENYTKKENFRIYYVLDQNNVNNLNQFTITVETIKELFTKYKPEIGVKKEWNDNVYVATIFTKKSN